MCQLIVPLLLLFSLINSTYGRPATKQTSPQVVNTAGGSLRAVVISRPGLRSVEAFLGIQYATAERFRRPTPSTRRWKGVRITRDFGPACPQRIPDIDQLARTMPRGRLQYFRRLVTYLGNQDEDCLNLNLYVPMIHTIAGKLTSPAPGRSGTALLLFLFTVGSSKLLPIEFSLTLVLAVFLTEVTTKTKV